MYREIKFRGKHKHSNGWEYGSLQSFSDGGCSIITITLNTSKFLNKPICYQHNKSN